MWIVTAVVLISNRKFNPHNESWKLEQKICHETILVMALQIQYTQIPKEFCKSRFQESGEKISRDSERKKKVKCIKDEEYSQLKLNKLQKTITPKLIISQRISSIAILGGS